jgi:putative permease
MIDVIKRWYLRNFSDPQAVILVLLLIGGFFIVMFMGEMLAPLLASVIIAYLLEGLVNIMHKRGMPRLIAVIFVFTFFLTIMITMVLGLIPLLWQQLFEFVQELPAMIAKGQQLLMLLPEQYPSYITGEQVSDGVVALRAEISEFGQSALSRSIEAIPMLITLLVYLILVPLLVFFFLKDKAGIVHWLTAYMPKDRKLATKVWYEMDVQIGNYVRGKILEIFIVGGVTYIVFAVMGLNYAPLLGALVGLSVVVPYIGAAVATLPVALIGFFQWGLSAEFGYIILAYAVIQGLDGNLLVPLLFSEAVNLHPVAIIVAVLVFGGIWGFWGVFFAIPLATLVKAVLKSWPKVKPESYNTSVA